jgi:hypothetical protein
MNGNSQYPPPVVVAIERGVSDGPGWQGVTGAPDERGVTRRLDERGVTRRLDERGVTRRLDERGVTRRLDERGVTRRLDGRGVMAGPEWRGDTGRLDELSEAERLISDLTVLVEAGLVTVHPHVVGPARYGVASEVDDAA